MSPASLSESDSCPLPSGCGRRVLSVRVSADREPAVRVTCPGAPRVAAALRSRQQTGKMNFITDKTRKLPRTSGSHGQPVRESREGTGARGSVLLGSQRGTPGEQLTLSQWMAAWKRKKGAVRAVS